MKIILLTLLLNIDNVFAQQDLRFPLNDEFDWKKIEKQNKALKSGLIKQWEAEFNADCPSGIWPANYDLKHLHVFDFNKDGLDDIVYEGPSNGEAHLVAFYLNMGDSFKIVLEDIQQIFKLDFENGRVAKIFLNDSGCCCSIAGKNKVYIADYDFKQTKFELLYTTSFLSPTELPIKYLEKIEKVQISKTTFLHIEPSFKDTIRFQLCVFDEVQSNIMAEIPVNSFAYKLAEKTDPDGNKWIFIALFPETRLKNSVFSQFYSSGAKNASYKLGWVDAISL